MKKMLDIQFVCAVAAAAILLFDSAETPARADDVSEQERVFQRRQSEEILSFKDILQAVRPLIEGEIIEAEFEVDHDIPVYEFKYIDQAGHVREMYVDARTGRVLKEEFD